MKRIMTIAVIALAVLAILPLTSLAAPVGKITHLEGRVDVTAAGKARDAKLGDPVNIGDILRTKSKARAEVTFVNGNILRMAENTRTRVTDYRQEEGKTSTLDLFRGKIQNIVSGLAKNARYEVRTPTSVCGVRGTNFFAFFQGGVSGFVPQQGTIYGYNLNMPQNVMTVTVGQALLVMAANQLPVIQPATSIELQQHIYDTAPSQTTTETTAATTSETTAATTTATTAPTTIPTVLTTVFTTGFSTIPSTIYTTILTTIPTTISATTAQTTVPTTAPTTVPTTVSTTIPTTVSTTVPTTVSTTMPTTVSTTVPTTVSTTMPTTVSTTVSTTFYTTVPTTVSTTVPTTIPTTIRTTIPTTVSTTIPTTIRTTVPTTVSTTVTTTVATTVTTTVVPTVYFGVPGSETAVGNLVVGTLTDVGGGTKTGAIGLAMQYDQVTPGPPPTYLAPSSEVGYLAGNLSDGSLLQGFVASVPGSWMGATSGVYQTLAGKVGLMLGYLSGGYESASGLLTASGGLTLTPAVLSPEEGVVNTSLAPMPGAAGVLVDAEGAAYIASGVAQLKPNKGLGFTGLYSDGSPGAIQAWGLDNLNGEGIFSYSDSSGGTTWKAGYGYMFPYTETMMGFLVGKAAGTELDATHVRLSGRDLLYITPQYYDGNTPVPGWMGYGNFEYWGKDAGSSGGAGILEAKPLAFASYWGDHGPGCLFANDYGSEIHAGDEWGLVGSWTSPWPGSAAIKVAGAFMMESGSGGYPGYVWGSPFNSRGYGYAGFDEVNWIYPEMKSGEHFGYTTGGIGPFAQAVDGVWQREARGDLAAVYVKDGKAGLLTTFNPASPATTGGLSGYFFPDAASGESGYWRLDGTLTATQKETVLPAGGLSGRVSYLEMMGLYADEAASLLGTGIDCHTFYLYPTLQGPQKGMPWGIYTLRFEGQYQTTDSSPEEAMSGKNITFGGYSEDPDRKSYFLGDLKNAVWTATGSNDTGGESGQVTGLFDGSYVSASEMGTFRGPFSGLYDEAEAGAGGWIGRSVGTYSGNISDYGGEWGHSLLYNDSGFVEWNSESYDNTGLFGFKKRLDGKFDFLAIGQYVDYGFGEAGYGGPYLWSGALYDAERTPNRYLEAFTAGLWGSTVWQTQPLNGGMNGYAAAVYFTEARKAGLAKGDLTGNFHLMGGEVGGDVGAEMVYGMWTVASGESGLANIDKTSSLPGDFDVSTAWIDYGGVGADLIGGFGAAGNVGTISGSCSGGKTKFITYGATETKSLPFGIFNLKWGGNTVPNTFTGKPDGVSVPWKAKTGGDGEFGYNLGDCGYWMANIASTWDEVQIDGVGAGYGTINGALTGEYLTGTHMGTIAGPFYGLFTQDGEVGYGGYGGWVGGSVGTYEGSPLALNGEIAGSLKYYKKVDGLVSGGSTNGLIGSTANPLLGPATALLMGGYSPNEGYREPSLMYDSEGSFFGGGLGMDTATTADDGSHNGYIVGVWNNGAIERARSLSLFTRSNGKAGWMYSSGVLTGTYDPAFEMWRASGTLATYEVPGADSTGLDVMDNLMHGSLGGSAKVSGGGYSVKADVVEGATLGLINQSPVWGIWNMGVGGTYTGSPASSFTTRIGGDFSYEDGGYGGYWAGDLNVSDWSNHRTTAALTNGRFLTERSTGEILTGTYGGIMGTYGDVIYTGDPNYGTWEAAGVGIYRNVLPLAFSSYVTGWPFWGRMGITNTGGGTDNLWTTKTSDLWLMGEYAYEPPLNAPPLLFSTADDVVNGYTRSGVGGAYSGLLDLAWDSLDNVSGWLIALYSNSGKGGVLFGDVSGKAHLTNPTGGMWDATGTLKAYEMEDIGSAVNENTFTADYTSAPIDITAQTGGVDNLKNVDRKSKWIAGESWGIWRDKASGTYTGTAGGAEKWLMARETGPFAWGATLGGEYLSYNMAAPPAGTGVSTGTVAGAQAVWNAASPLIAATPSYTVITGGVVKGLFDPNDANTWKTLSQGGFMETSAFLGKTFATDADRTNFEKAMKIPAFDVGMANLRGNDGQGTPNLYVNMDGIKFFRFQAEANPRIWATGNVYGSYTADPALGTKVMLTSSGGLTDLTHTFEVKQWNTTNSTWGASIYRGAGTDGTLTRSATDATRPSPLYLPTGAPPTIPITEMRGAAAGTITPGVNNTAAHGQLLPGTSSFSGTAAGTVKIGVGGPQ